MGKLAERSGASASHKPRPNRKHPGGKRGAKALSKEVQEELDGYRELVEQFAKLKVVPFNAAEEQREQRRKEMGS